MSLAETMYRSPISCTPDTPVHQVARLMGEHQVGSVVVVDDDHRPVGIVTDRDIALRLVGAERHPADAVRFVMTAEPVTLSSEASGVDAARHMAASGCRRLPVIEPALGRLVGVVSLDDLLLGSAETLDRLVRLLGSERQADDISIEVCSPRPTRSWW